MITLKIHHLTKENNGSILPRGCFHSLHVDTDLILTDAPIGCITTRGNWLIECMKEDCKSYDPTKHGPGDSI